MMVDYTDFEEERLREKKGKCFHHHRRPTTERRSMRNKNEFEVYATMKFFVL